MARYENRPDATVSRLDVKSRKVIILVSEWNSEVTESMYTAAVQTLRKHGLPKEHIIKKPVPGSYELSIGAQWAAEQEDIHGVIAIGCVIQGETPHFDYICSAVAKGLTDVSLKYNKPVIFGVLTTLTLQQALDRAGGKYGNKGDEAAETLVKLWNW